MTLFEGLLMAHLLGDWLLQTEWQAQNKENHWGAMLTHILVYHAVMFGALYFGFKLSLITVAWTIGFLAVTHIILDRRSTVRWLLKVLRLTVKRPQERWLIIAIDQTLHLLLLGLVSLAITTWGQ